MAEIVSLVIIGLTVVLFNAIMIEDTYMVFLSLFYTILCVLLLISVYVVQYYNAKIRKQQEELRKMMRENSNMLKYNKFQVKVYETKTKGKIRIRM